MDYKQRKLGAAQCTAKCSHMSMGEEMLRWTASPSPSSPPCDTLALQQCRGGPAPPAPPALRHHRHIASNTAQGAEMAPFLPWGELNCVRLKPTPTSAAVGENWVKHLVEERADLLHNFGEEKASGKPPGQACRSSRRKQAAPLLLLQTFYWNDSPATV